MAVGAADQVQRPAASGLTPGEQALAPKEAAPVGEVPSDFADGHHAWLELLRQVVETPVAQLIAGAVKSPSAAQLWCGAVESVQPSDRTDRVEALAGQSCPAELVESQVRCHQQVCARVAALDQKMKTLRPREQRPVLETLLHDARVSGDLRTKLEHIVALQTQIQAKATARAAAIREHRDGPSWSETREGIQKLRAEQTKLLDEVQTELYREENVEVRAAAYQHHEEAIDPGCTERNGYSLAELLVLQDDLTLAYQLLHQQVVLSSDFAERDEETERIDDKRDQEADDRQRMHRRDADRRAARRPLIPKDQVTVGRCGPIVA